MTSKTDEASKARNLLWRWYMHREGEGAFNESFPAKRCNDPLWRLMDKAMYGYPVSSSKRDDGLRTYTDRLFEIVPVGSTFPDGLSPKAAQMIECAAHGYPNPQAIPKATREAMLEWLNERRSILSDFGKFFDKDKSWHPYQRCLWLVGSDLYALSQALEEAFMAPVLSSSDNVQLLTRRDGGSK